MMCHDLSFIFVKCNDTSIITLHLNFIMLNINAFLLTYVEELDTWVGVTTYIGIVGD